MSDGDRGVDVSRRENLNALLAVFGGAAGLALTGCGQGEGGAPEPTGSIPQALAQAGGVVYADTVADLRRTTWDKLAVLGGYYARGDGGGGLFYWDTTAAPDDGGTILNAQQGNSAGWRRIYSGVINVKWFGARGDGTTPDDAAIQAALDLAKATLAGTTPTYGEMNSGAEVYIPNGVYSITNELSLYDWLCLRGDHNTILKASPSLAVILRIGAYRNRIQNLCFVGGGHHIVAYGPSSHYGAALGGPGAGGPNWIFDCSFQYALGASFYIDTTPSSSGGSYPTGQQNQGSSASFHFNFCDMAGPVFFYGSADGVFYTDCYASWDLANGAVLDDNGNPLAAFNSGDHLSLTRFVGVPNTAGVAQAAWMQGQGVFKADDVRFGGESTYTTMRFRRDMPLGGMPMIVSWTGNELWLDKCAPTGNGSHDWMQVYDRFPNVVSVRLCEGGGVGNFGTTYGIWVDATSCPLSSFVNASVGTISISVEDPQQSYNLLRIYTSTVPTTPGTFPNDPAGPIDLYPQLRRFINGYRPKDIREPLENLYSTPIADICGGQGWNDGSVAVARGTDNTTNYVLTSETATRDGGMVQRSDPTAWGMNQPAGEYTFSLYAKSTFGARLFAGWTPANGASVWAAVLQVPNAGAFERLSFTFWHDGSTPKQFLFACYNVPLGATLVVGMPMINRGSQVAPYVFPGTSTVEELVRPQYFGAAPPSDPSAGWYSVGDTMWNTAPSAGGVMGWVCVAAGNPGTWKAFGAILP
jgi:hypothetical protein